MSNWSLYLIETANGQLYAGISTDVSRRFGEHQANGAKTARSLRGKGPLTLKFQQPIGDHGMALRLERKVKQLPRAKKLSLIAQQWSLLDLVDS
ncbi:GIY-YIG nuclease family protein [Ferrimonas senticii]|uniref:GIY-YIG nuclease family protein n=1 Tax=Ferrimonas senticii TaxID=394566 RepID=UPI0004185E7B|nr:GIY-YIG nuclease family protein [Ferrimonas senticii]